MRGLGAYRLGELLGRGGAGTVHRGWAPDGTPVAIKLVHGGRVLREPEQRRFAREAAALLRLDHPSLVRARDVIQEQGRAAVVMTLVEGEDLESRLGRTGPLPADEVARLGLELARGLAHAHARGIVHRDVKPANVVVAADGRPVLVDFGLARDLAPDRSQLTRTGAILGTPGYWPPEQARGELERIGPASDLYSLGATLYCLLSGHPPIEADSFPMALEAVLRDEPRPLLVERPELDPALAAIVHRCLTKAPEGRWPDAAALGDALEGWLQGALTRTRPQPASSPAPLLAAVVILCGGAGLALALVATGGRGGSPGAEVTGPPPAPPSGPPPLEPTTAATAPRRSEAERESALRAVRAEQAGGKLDSALARAATLFDEDPTDPELLKLLVSLRSTAGRGGAELLPVFERALTADPGFATARAGRALVFLSLARYDEAVADAERLLSDPSGAPLDDQAAAHYVRGACRARRGDAQGARQDYDQALGLAPEHTLARMERGTLRAMDGDTRGALRDLDLVLALGVGNDASHARALALRGATLQVLGRALDARVDLEAALPELDPSDPLCAAARDLLPSLPALPSPAPPDPEVGRIRSEALRLAQSRDLAGAVARLDAGLATHPDPELRVLRGAILIDLQDHPRAIEELERASRELPAKAELWKQLGTARLRHGLAEAGMDALLRGLSLAPRDAPSWGTLGHGYMTLKQPGEAEAAYTRAIGVGDQDGLVRHQRGMIRSERGDLRGAVEDLTRALELGYRSGGTYAVRARALERLGELAAARRDYAAALPLLQADDPNLDFVRRKVEELR